MPDSGWIDAVGFGSAVLSGGAEVGVQYVDVQVISFTNPRIRSFGSTFPRRLLYAGSVQLLTGEHDVNGVQQQIPTVDFPVSFEMFEWPAPTFAFGLLGITEVQWELPSGIEIKIRVFW